MPFSLGYRVTERVRVIETPPSRWQRDAQPLSYTRVAEMGEHDSQRHDGAARFSKPARSPIGSISVAEGGAHDAHALAGAHCFRNRPGP